MSIVGTSLLIVIAFILYKTNFGSIYKSEFILQFRFLKSEDSEPKYNDIMKQYSKSSTLLNAEPSGDNKTIKLTFDILMKEDKELNKFVSAITNVAGVSEVALVAAKSDIDY